MYTDPISDMLTRVRNAVSAGKQETVVPHSKFKLALAKLLTREGYFSGYSETHAFPKLIKLQIRYSGNEPVISGIKRISKPGQRIYLSAVKIPRTNSGLGTTVVSTPKGLMTDREARKANLGGEVICEVW